MGVNGEALRLHAVYKKPYFLLQVTQESISGTSTTSHMLSSERAMKLKVCMTKSLSPWYQAIPEKNITCLLPLALLLIVLRTQQYRRQQTRDIALYYGDTCIILS